VRERAAEQIIEKSVRKAVAAFFSTGHSLDTLVAQLVEYAEFFLPIW